MATNDEIGRNLTIYLLKPAFSSDPIAAIHCEKVVETVEIQGPDGDVWPLHIHREEPHPPKWAVYFAEHGIEPRRLGQVSTAGALLFVPLRDLWFAVAFGQGRHILRTNAFQGSFGLRVALNAIADGSLRSVDVETFDAVADHRRSQASREAEARDFGLDVERDLVWAVTGKPARGVVGNRITGRDALCTNAPVRLSQLQDYLSIIHELYLDEAFREHYPWVERINEVKDDAILESLDEEMVRLVQTKPLKNTWLAPPEVLEWERVCRFGFGRGSRSFEVHDLHWNHYFREIRQPEKIDIDTLRRGSTFCFGEDGTPIKRWDLYKCIYAELDLVQGQFFLSGGRWYMVDRDLVAEVDRFLESVHWIDIGLPEFESDKDEDGYNLRVAKEWPNKFHLGHRRLPYVRDGRNQIELCDLASTTGELIHIKRYRSSKDLSHLFAQGFASVEAFQIDEGYRRQAYEMLPGVLPGDPAKPPARNMLTVVYAIISTSKRQFRLPFFSRLSLRHVTKRLREGYGYQVALSRVATAEERAGIRVVRGRERAKRSKSGSRSEGEGFHSQ